VREEMATREAMAMGLDRDDTIIRRRLRQKLEFLAEDSIDATPPTDAELQAWLDQHPEKFRVEPEVAFRQVYLSPDKRGPAVDDDARALLARLSTAAAPVEIDTLGDSLMLPHEVERSTRTEVARQFGEEFADALLKVEPGRWQGPIRSGYGLHLVLVQERQEGRSPLLVEVRPVVEREFLSDRRRRELNAMYERMLERYRVTVEQRGAARQNADATTSVPAAAPGGSK
jgi:hypothetical protein